MPNKVTFDIIGNASSILRAVKQTRAGFDRLKNQTDKFSKNLKTRGDSIARYGEQIKSYGLSMASSVLNAVDQTRAGFKKFGEDENKFQETLRKSGENFENYGGQIRNVGLALAASITLPLALFVKSTSDAARAFETSFTGVKKTVDATEAEFASLSAGFRQMAKDIPIAVDELNGIGEAAGQLGIKTENILGFTKTVAQLAVTTNLTADAAANALARIANITGLQQDQFDRLGAAIVDLGNNFAVTESEIVEFGLRIAGGW